MKKYYVRIITLALSIALIVSTFPTPLSSRVITAHAETMNVNQDDNLADASQATSNLQPFTGTKDLVAAMKAELSQRRSFSRVSGNKEQANQILSDTIEKKCGYTLTEIKSLLAISIFKERDQDKVDVSKYNLSIDEIQSIIDLVLEDYCAADLIDVSVNADENGFAQTISTDMDRGFEAGLDALDEMDGVGDISPVTENVEGKETKQPAETPTVIPTETPEVSETKARKVTIALRDAEATSPGAIDAEATSPGAIDAEATTPGAIRAEFTWSEPDFTKDDIPYTCTVKFTGGENNIETTEECTVTRDTEQTQTITYKATCQFEGKEYSDTKDATTQQLYSHWGTLCTFYGQSAEYYGVSTEFWSTKNIESSPFGALKVLAGYAIDTPVPAPNMDDLITGINQALQAYVYYYGDALKEARNEAIASIDKNMTPLQKCLVLHDYLATHAVFDMASLMKYREGDKQSDPISATPFGALLYGKIPDPEGKLNGCVCLGYAAAYTYLVQCAFPEIYQEENGNFKSCEDVMESGKDMVDFVMIRYNCDVAEVSVTEGEDGFTGTFTEPHYYNVVKLDGKWYNVDVCYDDIKTETLTQYRVETDGNCSHMYFLVSEQTLEDWYEGKYQYIDSLHGTKEGIPEEERCSDQTYEDAWFSNIDCPISYDGEYWYFVEAQFSELDMMDNENSEDGNQSGSYLSDMDDEQMADLMKNMGDQMKLRPRDAGDSSDEKGTVLFDYGKGTVFNLKTGVTTEGVLEEDCDDDIQMNKIYPDLAHSLSLYNNRLYFNLDNKVYMYNLEDGAVTQLKEYNTVYAKSNGTPFIGSSFYITNAQDENLKFTVKNHPLAGLCIKDDKIMYVSVATNYSQSSCSNYEKESVNFNLMYNRFAKDKSEDDNKNTEFMWCANVKDNLCMSDVDTYLKGGTELENVVVEPYCGKQGYTEGRDKTHGFSAGTDKKDFTDAKEHHYLFIDKEGCYICSCCYMALDKETAEEKGIKTGHIYGAPVFKWEEMEIGGYKCTATFACICKDDVQVVDATVTSKEETTVGDSQGNKERKIVYTATCVFGGKTYTDTKTVVESLIEPTVTGIKVKTNPVKTSYIEGETFDATGMVVEKTYSDGTTEGITDYTYSPNAALTVSNKIITISYEEYTTTVNITVEKAIIKPTVTGIKVRTNPVKMSYIEGETFDVTGMVVEKVYSDGTTEGITDYTYSPKTALAVSNKTITISYGKYTAAINITVNSKNTNTGNNNPGSYVPSAPVSTASSIKNLEPEVEGNSSIVGWDKIIKYMQQWTVGALANEAKQSQISITIDMNDTTEVPKNVFEVIKGYNIEVVFKLNDGNAWKVNGNNITGSMLTAIDFAINYSNQMVPKEQLEALLGAEAASKVSASQFSVKYNETIGYDAILILDLNRQINALKENKNLQELAQIDKGKIIANLFSYDQGTGKLNLQSVDRVSVDGKADFSLGSNSEYVVILSTQVIFDADTLAKFNVNGIAAGQSFNKTLYIGGTEGQTVMLTTMLPDVVQEAIDEQLVTGMTYYSSSNSSIAKIYSSGEVVAKKPGTATITATVVIGENKYEYKMILCVKKAYIQFKESTPVLKIGEKAKFTVSVGGYDITKLNWKSSKENIADVQKNVGKKSAYVTGLTEGTEYIYVQIPLKNGKSVTKQVKISVEASNK